jgi:hypothetical protein
MEKSKVHNNLGPLLSELRDNQIIKAVREAGLLNESSVTQLRKNLAAAYLALLQIVKDPTGADIAGCVGEVVTCLEDYEQFVRALEEEVAD